MDIKLVVASGKSAGKIIPVQGPEFLIGRGEECQLRPGSDRVSRKHCSLVVDEGRAVVRDFKSTNGTFVNGERIEGERELKTGDRLRVGNLEFEVQLSVAVGGKKKPKVTNIQEAAARLAKTSAEDEIDVSDWLTQTETVISDAAADTRAYVPSYAQGQAPRREDDDDPRSSRPAKTDSTHRLFDTNQSGQKTPNTANSRQAADEVLKRMMKGGEQK